ncbi:MAG: FmdB family zinc ribbon protein [Tepidiformaceae bacterium]
MPTYEYHCKRCEATYDLQESFSAATTHRCKECKRGMAKRVLHAPRILFKGSGFYATDSKNKEAAVAEGDSGVKGETAKSEPKGDSKGDSKGESSAAKSTPKADSGGSETATPAAT